MTLFNPNGSKVDEISYEKAPRGESFSKINSSWIWSLSLTPGGPNTLPEQKPQEKANYSPQAESLSENQEKEGLAAIKEQAPKNLSPLFILLIALAVAFLSGIIILFLKKFIASSNIPDQTG